MKQALFATLLCASALLWAQEAPVPATDPAVEPAPVAEPAPTAPPAPASAPAPAATPAPAVEPAPQSVPAPVVPAKPTVPPTPRTLRDHLADTEIGAAAIRDAAPKTLPDALNGVPGLFFREAGAGLAYPVLRGMPSEAVPVIFDGIALSRTIFTGGTGAWLSLLDRRLAERITVTNGPDTVSAGSAAAGGSITLHPFTTAAVRGTPEFTATGRFNTRFSSADTDRDAHARLAGGYGNFGALAAGSVGFSDARTNGAGNEEPFSSFENYGAFFTGDWAFTRDTGSSWQLSLGYLFGGLNDAADLSGLAADGDTPDTVQRYERTAHVAWGRLAMDLPAADLKGVFTLSYQNAFEAAETSFIGDGRSLWRARERNETTGNTAGIDIDFTAAITPRLFTLRYGGEYYHDFIGTAHFERSDAAAALAAAGTAVLPDDSACDRFAGYLTGLFDLLPAESAHHLTATAGYRFEGTTLRAPERGDIPALNLTEPGHAVEARIAYGWRENFGAALTYAHGTRPATLREAAFYGMRDGLFFVPNGGIEAETTDTLDLTLRGQTKRVAVTVSGFATHVADRIGRVAASWNGLTTIQGFPVAGYVNTGRALIWGITANKTLTIPFGFTLSGGTSYLWGEERLKNDRIAMLDQIPPLLWNASLRWDSAEPGQYQGFVELAVRGATDPGAGKSVTIDDTVTYPLDRSSWQVLTVRGGFVFDRYIRLSLSLENLLDRDYRPYLAGLNGTGINAVLALDAEF